MSIQPEGYFALPTSGQGRPVLVLHPWWGLNETIRAFCRRLADTGFVAFAPDLYHGQLTDKIDEAETLVNALNGQSSQAQSEVVAAAHFLNTYAGPSAQGLAVIGFSMGASYAVALSTNAPDLVRAVVLFYGAGEGDYTKSQAAYLGHFAENDPYESREYIDYMEQGMRAAGCPVTFHTYPETTHWFFETDRSDAYNAAAAELAWERTLAFLQER